MRKFLLASVATLGTGGLAGAAYAQAPAAAAAPPPTFTQGQVATAPSAAPPSFANNNNNYQAPALPGPVANPTPGTIVVHFNGKVQVDFEGHWSSADKRTVAAPAGTPGGAAIVPGTTQAGAALTTVPSSTAGTVSSLITGSTAAVPSGATSAAAILGNNGAGTVSINPQEISSFARLYAGMDGMATNGLRYGAAIEVRENFTGQIGNAASSGASGYSSLETLYVRRAFTYVAGENWGIFRAGQADGLIGIFDNGVTTFQFLPTGNLNGGDLEGNTPANVNVPFFFLGQAGNEYDNSKLVYLSPQIAGFDFGLQYAPNTSNGFGMGGSNNALNGSIIGAGTGTGLGCTVANSGCPTLTSGPGSLDGTRITNQTALGVRYQGVLGGVGVLAYGVYMFSGHTTYTGAASTTVVGATNLGLLGSTSTPAVAAASHFTGNYNGLSFGSGGLALSYAGFTVGGNVIGGNLNGQLALQPQGGAPEVAVLLGAKYVNGPWTMGIVAEDGWYQGAQQMTGISQRRGRAIDFGASYTVAPGYIVYAEYMWQDIQQSDVNLITGALGTGANNNIRGQGFLIGNVVNF